MIEIDGVIGLVLLALWVWAIFDVIATDASLCRNLPKSAWLMLVLILPDLGAMAWWALGRPEGVGWRPGSTDTGRAGGTGTRSDSGWSTRQSTNQMRASADETVLDHHARRREEADRAREELLERRARDDELARLRRWEADLAAREAALGQGSSDTPG